MPIHNKQHSYTPWTSIYHQKNVILLLWEKPRANIHVSYMNLSLIEYPELKWIQKNHHNSNPGPAKDDPKSHTMCLRTSSKCFLSLSGLELWPLLWGAVPVLTWKNFTVWVKSLLFHIPLKCPLTQFHVVPSRSWGILVTRQKKSVSSLPLMRKLQS